MEAQTVTWLVFLALIKHVSTSDSTSPFKLEPGVLPATEGSCIEIKCQVTRNVDDSDANWFWMKDARWVDGDFTSTVIYSKNTSTRPVSPDFANRVNYIGSLSSSWQNANSARWKPLCSICICDLRRSDSGKYSLRFEGTGKWKWSSEEVTLNVEDPPTEPKLSMSSEVTEGQTITISCTAESFPQSTLTLMRIDKCHQYLKIPENNLNSRPIHPLYHTFTVTSADAGWYFCRAQNTEGSKDSKWKELVVKFSLNHTHITESAEKQEPDGRSSVMLSCFSHSFPPVHNYSWYRKSQGEEQDELVSEHQNHTVYSNQPGVYYCVAQNDVGRRWSDPVHLFERNYLDILKFLLPALFVLMIIILIIVVLRFRKKKSIQQGTTNTKSPSGFSEQLSRPDAPGCQPLPDSTPPTDINLVYSSLNLPQAASARNPTRRDGNTEDYSVHYAPLHFKTNIKKKQRKVEEDSVYAMVSNPTQVKKE